MHSVSFSIICTDECQEAFEKSHYLSILMLQYIYSAVRHGVKRRARFHGCADNQSAYFKNL